MINNYKLQFYDKIFSGGEGQESKKGTLEWLFHGWNE